METRKRKREINFDFLKINRENIVISKRGLSAVITTLIVILLVLVSVGILWVVVRNLIQEGAEQIDLGAFTLDLQIKKVEVTGDNVTVTVFVKRNPGQGNFVGINFVFSDGKNSEIMREDTVLKELEERSFTFTLTEISTNELETVSIAPIYELSSGRESTGDLSDTFDAKKGKSIATGGVVGAPEGNFAALGFTGSGMKEYSFSSQSEEIVKFIKAIVNPLDVLPGDNQTFTVEVSSPNGIDTVTSITELDNSILNLDFEHISGDGGSTETWSVSWIVNDTHTIEYRTKITATDLAGNQNSVTLTWTDSCQSLITHGIDSTISTSCTTEVDAIAGIDGGSLTIAADRTLTIESGSTFIFNQGQSIIITASGAQIVSTSTGSFGNGDLYYTDADVDSHAPNSVLSIGSGGVRAKDALSTTDCNDGNNNVYQNVAGLANDADFDGHYIGSVSTQCVGVSAGINVAQAGDPSDFKIYYDDTSGTSFWIIAAQAYGSSDCDNTLKYMGPTRTGYTDSDDDGYDVGSSSFCARYVTWGCSACSSCVGSSHSKDGAGTCKLITTLGTDCNDGSSVVQTTRTQCATSSSQGPKNPGTVVDSSEVGIVIWQNPSNAKTSNDVDAVGGAPLEASSHYLKATNFGFSIPSGMTIDGIKVEIEQLGRKIATAGLPNENSIKIVKGGTIQGNEKSTGAVLPSTDTYITYGGATDLWGLSWSASNINAANFGVGFSVALHGFFTVSSIAEVDHIRITVYYTEPGVNFCASSSTWGNSACTTGGSNYAKNISSSCLQIAAC